MCESIPVRHLAVLRFTEMESRMVATGVWGGEDGELVFNGEFVFNGCGGSVSRDAWW